MTSATKPRVRRLIELACRAPSVHNTQPWRWRIGRDDSIELYADRARQLPVADPAGRNLTISCGAALHHLIVAGRATGVTVTADLSPEPDDPNLLARTRLAPANLPKDGPDVLDALERRCTDRRRFTSWPVPESRLTHLAQAAAGWGAYALPIVDPSARFRTELLLGRAQKEQRADPRFLAEQHVWTEHSRHDGVPQPNATPRSRVPASERSNRFAPDPPIASSGAMIENSDGLVTVCTAQDDQRSWLEAGQVLSALWLRATHEGLSLVPLSQVIEVEATRLALQDDILGGMAHTQILLRIGWQEIGRASLAPTPRRTLDDVLLR